MLLNLREYSRPAAEGGNLQDALALLARPDIHTVLLAGGDTLVGSGDRSIEAVVDLQGLGLGHLSMTKDPAGLEIGTLVTRTDLVSWPAQMAEHVQGAPELKRLVAFLAVAARRWGGNIQRNRATVGGAIVTADADDALVAALLACSATVTLQDPAGARSMSLDAFLSQRATLLLEPIIITHVNVSAQPAAYALETVARTPLDTPIVLAAACVSHDATRLALGGVSDAPVLVTFGEQVAPQMIPAIAAHVAESVNPTGDFRGSTEYRRAMVRVLSERALTAALEGIG